MHSPLLGRSCMQTDQMDLCPPPLSTPFLALAAPLYAGSEQGQPQAPHRRSSCVPVLAGTSGVHRLRRSLRLLCKQQHSRVGSVAPKSVGQGHWHAAGACGAGTAVRPGARHVRGSGTWQRLPLLAAREAARPGRLLRQRHSLQLWRAAAGAAAMIALPYMYSAVMC